MELHELHSWSGSYEFGGPLVAAVIEQSGDSNDLVFILCRAAPDTSGWLRPKIWYVPTKGIINNGKLMLLCFKNLD